MPDMTWEDVAKNLADAIWECTGDMGVFCEEFCPASPDNGMLCCDTYGTKHCNEHIMVWAREQVGK